MNQKFFSPFRSLIYILLILALMSAYTPSPTARPVSPALGDTGNGHALVVLLNRIGIQVYRVLAATSEPDEYTTNEDTVLNEPAVSGLLAEDTFTPPATVTIDDGITIGTVAKDGDEGAFIYNPNGQFEYLATGVSTSDTFSYTVTDVDGESGPATVTISINGVNDLPVITQGASTNVNMDEDGTPTEFTLTLDATDVDNDTLTWSISTQASNGTASASGTGASMPIGYTPNDDYNGTDSFDVQVSDSNGGTPTITVNVNIAPQSDDPVIAQGDSVDVNMDEDGSPTAFTLTLEATDADNDTLTWSISSQASHGTASASGTGNSMLIGYAPTAHYSGPDSFVVQVDDGTGGIDTITVNVNVAAQNDAPEITQGNSVSVNMDEDGTPDDFELTLNATDVEVDTLTWSISSQASHGTASISGEATGNSKAISYTPDANYNGSDSFIVQVSDGNGGTDTITVNLDIDPRNDAPEITETSPVEINMDEDGTPDNFELTLHATDADVGDTLTWSISTQASNGTATASGNGTSKAISYSPDEDYNGTDSFVVRVTDGDDTDTITVNVDIDPQSDEPIITQGPSLTVNMDEDGSPQAFELILDATDPDGDTLTWSIETEASHGTATASGIGSSKVIGYTPDENYFGEDSFVVQVSDGTGSDPDKITVNVEINSVNDAPTGLSDGYEVVQGDTLTVAAPGVLNNDSDPEGDPMTAVKITNPQHGTLTLQANGAFTYNPASGFAGQDSFTYKAKDSAGRTSADIQVIINVKDAASPSVEWIEPVPDGEQMDVNGETVILKVEATDDVSIARVRFYRWDPNSGANGSFVDIFIDNTFPYEVELNTSILNYEFNEIRARAYDGSGNVSFYKWIWLYRLPPTDYFFIPLIGGE